MTIKQSLASLIILLTASGCAGLTTPIPDPQSTGAQLFSEKCGVCHALPHPQRHTGAQWQHIVVLMERRIDERGLTALTTAEREAILKYLQQHGRT